MPIGKFGAVFFDRYAIIFGLLFGSDILGLFFGVCSPVFCAISRRSALPKTNFRHLFANLTDYM